MNVHGVSRSEPVQPVRDLQAAALAAQSAIASRAQRAAAAAIATAPELTTTPGVPPGTDGTRVDLFL
jgi:hypothetical protein